MKDVFTMMEKYYARHIVNKIQKLTHEYKNIETMDKLPKGEINAVVMIKQEIMQKRMKRETERKK